MGTNSTGCTEWERDYDPVTEQPMTHHQIDVLDLASLFLHIATPDEIEHERQRMEYEQGQVLAVHDIETVTRSGTRCTRVTWRCL